MSDPQLPDPELAREDLPQSTGFDPEATFYPDLSSFVRHIMVDVLLSRVDGRVRTWCPRWWEHAEAVLRLEALWLAWEQSRLEGGAGMSCWLRDHADYHLPVLLDPDAAFRGCSPERGHQPRGRGAVTWQAPPAGL